jgi:glutaredoxin 3
MAAHVKIYTRRWCGYCTAALNLLDEKGIEYEHVDATGDRETRRWLQEVTGRGTVPQIFIDGQPIGGYDDMRALDRKGELDRMIWRDDKAHSSSGSGASSSG